MLLNSLAYCAWNSVDSFKIRLKEKWAEKKKTMIILKRRLFFKWTQSKFRRKSKKKQKTHGIMGNKKPPCL